MINRQAEIRKPESDCCVFGEACAIFPICDTICKEKGFKPYGIIKSSRNVISLLNSFQGALVVRKGMALSLADSINGKPCVFTVFGVGAALGLDPEFPSVDNGRLLTVVDTEFCFLPTTSLNRVIHDDPRLLRGILDTIVANSHQLAKYVWVLHGACAYDRVQRFFSLYSDLNREDTAKDITVPLSHENLALIIEAERATVSRTLGELVGLGLVELRTRSIIVKREFWTSSQYLPENQLGNLRSDPRY
jgi:CRP-like cAMP-binding protein